MGNCAKKCNICLEYKLVNYKKCILCTNGLVCNECYNKMNEDQKSICPLCRQQKWLKIKKNKVIPEDKFIDIKRQDLDNYINEDDIEKFDILLFCSLIRKIGRLLCFLFILWIIGFFILICIFSYPYQKTKEDFIFVLLSLIIGIVSFLLLWCCCCPSVNLLGAILDN